MRHAMSLGFWLLASPAALCLAAQEAAEPAAEEPAYDLKCSYTARNDAPNLSENQRDYDWDQYEHCARVGPNGRMEVDPAHLERINVRDGFAEVAVFLKGWFYVRSDGASLSVINYGNSPDGWSEGLARGRRDNKIVFFNRQFEQAIEQRYDWASPFHDGHALVCEGCELEDSQREHPARVGGRWWFIDPTGKQVEHEHLSERQIEILEFHNKP